MTVILLLVMYIVAAGVILLRRRSVAGFWAARRANEVLMAYSAIMFLLMLQYLFGAADPATSPEFGAAIVLAATVMSAFFSTEKFSGYEPAPARG